MRVDAARGSLGRGRGLPRGVDLTERMCLSIPEAGRMLGVSRNFAYELARQGKLPVIQLGKRKLIPKIRLEKMLGGEESHEGSHQETR